MVTFDEEKQKKHIDDLYKQEEEDLVRVLAEAKYNLPYINLIPIPIENDSLRIIPEEDARKLEIGPFKLFGKDLHVAVFSPNTPGLDVLKNELIQRGFNVYIYMASHASLKKIWKRYEELSHAEKAKAGGLDISGAVLTKIGESISTIDDFKKKIQEIQKEKGTHSISRLLEVILAGAIKLNSSDIHLEPTADDVGIRFRLDGILRHITNLSLQSFKHINSRIKLVAGLKITIHDQAQDGRFSIFIEDTEINVRTSTMPSGYGESIVMRILNPKSIQVDLKTLGIEKRLLDIFHKEIKKPNGLKIGRAHV